jgi:glycosyltransferase involved in cell wall biosynthesis
LNVEIIPIHEPDGTISSSRNAAAAYGGDYDWLIYLDADDELAPGYIGAMEAAIERADNARTLFTPAVQTVRQGRTPGPPSFFREVPLRQANWLVIGTVVHRDLFWEVGGFPEAEHGLEDWGLWSKCARVGAEVVKVPDAVYRYWANPQSMHRQMWRDKKAQVAAHRRVAQELDEWEAAYAATTA